MDLSDLAAPRAGAMIPGVRVSVETVLLGVHETQLTYRVATAQLGDHEHPDALARTQAGLHGQHHPGALLHSTSWRFDPAGIVLTYAALPDRHPASADVLSEPVELPGSTDPTAPCSPRVDTVHVVTHACRHLAWLRHTDPLIAAVAGEQPDLWALIERHRPTVAGLLIQPNLTPTLP